MRQFGYQQELDETLEKIQPKVSVTVLGRNILVTTKTKKDNLLFFEFKN